MQRKHFTYLAITVVLAIGFAGGAVALYLRSSSLPGRSADDDDDGRGRGEVAGERKQGKVDRRSDQTPTVHLTTQQSGGLNLKTVAVRRGSLDRVIEVPGEVQWNADHVVRVMAQVQGVVLSVSKTLGDHVKSGDLLCVLNSSQMGTAKVEYLKILNELHATRVACEQAMTVHRNTEELLRILAENPTPEVALAKAHDLPIGENKNKLLTAYTRMRVSERKHERLEKLWAKKITSEADYMEAKGEFEVARTDYISTREEIAFGQKRAFLQAEQSLKFAEMQFRNAERALRILGLKTEDINSIQQHGQELDGSISRISLFSPAAGVIVDRHGTQGEQVGAETSLYTICDLSDVWVMGRVCERDVRFLRAHQKATVQLDAFPGEVFEGTVDYVGSQLNPESRTVDARIVLPNPQHRFLPGMFGMVTVFVERQGTTSNRDDGLVVPASALQRDGAGFVVYRAAKGDDFEPVPVQVIARSKDLAEVSGKLQIGDRVATGDTFVLKSEANKKQMEDQDD